MKGDIGIFTGVLLDFFYLYIPHATLTLPFFPNQFYNMDRFVAQVFCAEQVHASFPFGIYHIVRQHRIKNIPLQFNAMVLQYQQVILDVLTDPNLGGIFKKAVELQEKGFGFVSGIRAGNITTRAWLDGKTDAHNIGLVRIQSGGFGIKADLCFFFERGNQGLNFLSGLNKFIAVRRVVDVSFCRQGGIVFFFCSGIVCAGNRGATASKKIALYGGSFFNRACNGNVFAQDSFSNGPEFQLTEDVQEGLLVGFGNLEIFFMELNRNRRDDGSQFFAHDRKVLALPHFLTQCTLELVGIGQHVFNCAVFCQQLRSSLFTHTRNARYIVDSIAHHGQDVNHL